MSQPLRSTEDGAEEQKAISAILERDAAMKQRMAAIDVKRAQTSRWGGAFAVVLALGAIYLWVGDPPFLRRAPVAGPPPATLHAGARFTLYLLGCRIEEFRRARGRLPDRLDALGSVPEHVSYVRRGEDYYVLRYDNSEPALIYDSEFGNLAQLSGLSMQTLGVMGPEKKP